MKKLLIIVIEGCSLEYISLENTPNIYRIAKAGFCKCLKSAVPTISSVNHTTILSGKFPCEHRMIGNSIYHRSTGETELLENPGQQGIETILDFMHKKGASTAMLSVENWIPENLGRSVDFNICAENPQEILVRYLDMPAPPPAESMEAATWILDACWRLIKKNSIDTVYCATNDYMMRHYAPDSEEALTQMRKIDEWIGRIYDLDPERELYITGGCGMSGRANLVNLQQTLTWNGFDVYCHFPWREASDPSRRESINEEISTQQMGMSFLYLKGDSEQQKEKLEKFLEAAPYVDMVSPKEEAARRFNLPVDMIGDYLVFAAEGYTFGEFDGEEQEMEGARSNGALPERATPLIAVNASEVPEKYRYNRDIVKIIMEFGDKL